MVDSNAGTDGDAAASPQRSFWRRNWIGLLCGAVLLGLALVGAIITLPGLSRDSSDPSDTSHGDRASAFAICQDEMRSRLKVPAEAVFSGLEDAQIKQDGDTWIVLSEVDAADGAGGIVHSSYRCTAVHLQGTEYRVKATLLG